VWGNVDEEAQAPLFVPDGQGDARSPAVQLNGAATATESGMPYAEAIIARAAKAIGGRIVATGDLLSQLLGLETALDGVDLVIVAEPELASPGLAEPTLDCITRAAATHALPVVAITHRSSLSHFEKAEWGLHGVFETEGSVTLEDAGRRVARTWLR